MRRTGTEMGLFATQTNRGDIQVVLRPAEDDPVSLLTKPVRPPLNELENELKKQGKELDDKERANIRKKYRRRPIDAVMDEVKDELHDQFSENQLKIETVQIMQDELDDLSGASKPIEVKLFGSDQTELRRLAQEIADTMEEKGKGRGLQEVNSNVQAGNPDVKVRVKEREAERVGIKPEDVTRQMRGHVHRPDRGPGPGVVAAHHRRARPLPRRAAFRPRPVRPQPGAEPVAAIARRPNAAARRAAGSGADRAVVGRGRRDAGADAGRAVARQPAAGRVRDGGAERARGRPRLRGGRHPPVDGPADPADRLPLGAGRTRPPAAGGVLQPADRDGGGRSPGVRHAGLPVPLGGAAAGDIPDTTALDCQRSVRPVRHQHAAQRVVATWAPFCWSAWT